jgi:hypothetical protein
MIVWRSGEKLLGWGPFALCPKCNNNRLQHVVCSYHETEYLLIRKIDNASLPRAICHICGYVFAMKRDEVTEILWQGRENTKKYYQLMSYFNKKLFIRYLKKFEFNDLINYLIST